MKKIKIDKCLCLLLVIASLTAFMTSLTVFAAHTDGRTEVIARIETSPTDAVQASTDNTNALDPSDNTNISTGDIVSVFIVITLAVLIISALVICVLNKSVKQDKT